MARLDEQLEAVKSRKRGKPMAAPPPPEPVVPATEVAAPLISDSRKYPYDTLNIWKLRKLAQKRRIPHWHDRPRAGLLIALHAADEKLKGETK